MIDADPAISGYHQSHIDLMVRRLNAVLTAINEAGLVIVPREPTEAMVQNGVAAMGASLLEGNGRLDRQADGYRAMISATTTGKAG